IALGPGDLSGEGQARITFEPQRAVEELGRVDERVAVQTTQTRELGVLQSGNGAEDAHLLAMLELGLEAHHVEQRAEPVVLPQLYYRIRLARSRMRVGQSERLHRAVPQRLRSTFRHDFNRQTTVNIGRRPFTFVIA